MQRQHEVRRYSIFSGVQDGRASKWRAGGLGLLIIVGIVGVCALATFATDQTDRLVVANASQELTESTATIDTRANITTGKPATLLQPIDVPSSSTTSAMTSQGSARPNQLPSCDVSLRSVAIATRSTQLRAELSRHRHALSSLQTMGLVTRFLNPYMYNSKSSQEDLLHRSINAHIQRVYSSAIIHAHCTN
jgi:hypothetical protein